MYDPTQLPKINRAEVLVLSSSFSSPSKDEDAIGELRVQTPMCDKIISVVQLTDEDTQKAAHLWRQLPGGLQARCHTPPFGLRFYQENRLLLECSICWKCNNIYIREELAKQTYYHFAGKSDIAKKLYEIMKTATQRDPEGAYEAHVEQMRAEEEQQKQTWMQQINERLNEERSL